jgi:hypothetical protein
VLAATEDATTLATTEGATTIATTDDTTTLATTEDVTTLATTEDATTLATKDVTTAPTTEDTTTGLVAEYLEKATTNSEEITTALSTEGATTATVVGVATTFMEEMSMETLTGSTEDTTMSNATTEIPDVMPSIVGRFGGRGQVTQSAELVPVIVGVSLSVFGGFFFIFALMGTAAACFKNRRRHSQPNPVPESYPLRDPLSEDISIIII